MENKGFEGEGSQEEGPNAVIDRSEADLSTKVDVPADKVLPDKPYPGMTKEELLRFSDTPFWNRLRLGSLVRLYSCLHSQKRISLSRSYI